MSSDLERFLTAQDEHGTYGTVYESALSELRRGSKTSHWMWVVFPQLAGLGRSSTAQYYAIASLDEARDYLQHPVLGARLRESCLALLAIEHPDPERILGGIDAVKLRSSMTLFARADPDEPLFRNVLDVYYGGMPDDATDRLLGAAD